MEQKDSDSFKDFVFDGSRWRHELKGEWDPDSAKLEAIYSYGIAETTPEKWWEGILAMRGYNSKLVPKEHFAKYNAEMKEVQTVELGGAAFHPEAEKQICFIQKPKSYDPKHCVTLINFHGGACVFGTAENRIEVCNKMAVRTNAVVINCNYRKAPESKFPLPCYDAYAIIKQVIQDADTLGVNQSKIVLIGDSGGALLLLGAAQVFVEKGEQELVKLLVPMWPMCGDNLTGGLSPEWASYEKPFRYMDRFYEALCNDVAAQQKDGYIFPVRMQQEIVAKLPKAFVLTSEFDCYRRDSSKLAERFASVGRLEDFLVLPGLNHVSPLVMFPSDSPMQEAFWDKLSSVVNECL